MTQQKQQLTVGLEAHAELNTKTKLFCGCKNAFGAPPNTLCCPVCLGLPGALPVLNQAAVAAAVRLGLALGADVQLFSRMERKHYSYPDSPKGYQITQLSAPICTGGSLSFWCGDALQTVEITRIQLEEDAGKLLYDEAGNILADYNRCGVPLLEIVTEPQLHSALAAKAFLEELARVLLALGISDGKLQEGSLRADVNVSWGGEEPGPRVELKNVSSFGAVYRSIEGEALRQRQILDAGGVIARETRRWEDGPRTSVLLRGKEDAEDYRFFFEPDLPALLLEDNWVQAQRAAIPELPAARAGRYRALGLAGDKADALAADKARADFYDSCCASAPELFQAFANWMLGDIARYLREHTVRLADTRLTPQKLEDLQRMVETGALSFTAAKQVLEVLLQRDCTTHDAAEALDLLALHDADALHRLAAEVIAQNHKAAADYRAGKRQAFAYLVGRCMKESSGKADPISLKQCLEELLR